MKYLVAQHGNLSGAYEPQIGYDPGESLQPDSRQARSDS